MKHWMTGWLILAVVACSPLAQAEDKQADEKGGDAPKAETPKPAPPQATAADKKLAARARELMEKAEGTVGQEAANGLKHGWVADLIPVLEGKKKGNIKLARRIIGESVDLLERVADWPAPKPVQAPMTTEAPAIDGKLDDRAWQQAAEFKGMYAFNTTEQVENPSTVWRVTWDANCLYFAFECADSDVVAPELPRDGALYQHDCVEMFILPAWRTKTYWEVIVSPTAMIYDGLHSKQDKRFGSVPREFEDIAGLKVGHVVHGTANDSEDTDKGYTVEVAVPFDQLPAYMKGNKPQAGHVLHLMLARLDQNGGPEGKMIPYAFQPLMNWGHNVWNHAELKLMPAPK